MNLKKKLIVGSCTIVLLGFGFVAFMQSDIRADMNVKEVVLNENFESSAGVEKALSSRRKEAEKPRLETKTVLDALSGDKVLEVVETEYNKPFVEYYRNKLVGLAKTESHGIYMAMRGKTEGEEVAVRVEWQNKIFHPRSISSVRAAQRKIRPSELDEQNWTIVYYEFALPDYVDRNNVHVSLRGYGGSKFIGQVDSISVIRSEANIAEELLPSEIAVEVPEEKELAYVRTTLPLDNLALKPIQSILISGRGSMDSDRSFIRISMEDGQGKGYQIYENYSSVSGRGEFEIQLAREETALLSDAQIKNLHVLTDRDMVWEIHAIRLITETKNLDAELKESLKAKIEQIGDVELAKQEVRKEFKTEIDQAKIENLSEWGEERKLTDLKLGDTFLSEMTYEEKKEFFGGEAPNLSGFEYYQSGMWDIVDDDFEEPEMESIAEYENQLLEEELGNLPEIELSEIEESLEAEGMDLFDQETIIDNAGEDEVGLNSTAKAATKNIKVNREIANKLNAEVLPDSFDWRSAHGFDYTTPIDESGQGSRCESCWAWAAAGMIESGISTWYNQPDVNYDLSKQAAMCAPTDWKIKLFGGGGCSGGAPWDTLVYSRRQGLPLSEEVPYLAKTNKSSCQTVSRDRGAWKAGEIVPLGDVCIYHGSHCYGVPRDKMMKNIIDYGPITVGIKDWNHVMLAVGYFKSNNKIYWIFKNSWGNGDKPEKGQKDGWVYLSVPYRQRNAVHAFRSAPTTVKPEKKVANDKSLVQVSQPVYVCEDRDKDGYYNWGVGKVPPSSCVKTTGKSLGYLTTHRDCNDADARYPSGADMKYCPGPYDDNKNPPVVFPR